MKRVLVIHPGPGRETSTVSFRGQQIEIQRTGCGGSAERARSLIAEADGRVDAIGLEGMPVELELGCVRRPHAVGSALKAAASATPVVDGGGVRGALERWGVNLADRAQPGIFNQKRVLMVPGLNHGGLAQALSRRACHLEYADPEVFFGFPDLPGVGSRTTLGPAAVPTLERLKALPFEQLLPPPDGPRPRHASPSPFLKADVLAGDIGLIRRFAPSGLRHKTVVVEQADEADLEDLCRRGAAIAVTLMPSLDAGGGLGRWSAATAEAVLAALRPTPDTPLSEDTYLNLMADLEWAPTIRYLQPEEAEVHRFAFVIHPLDVRFIHQHRAFRWTRFLPDPLVEAAAAWMPPMYISRITGGRSPVTGQRIEGHLIALGATPRQMMRHGERFTYDRLNQAARLAERLGARLMGLGAFTSVVGDAGITVAHEAGIAVTSGNSLTVAATLEAAKEAVRRMGHEDLSRGKVMIIGATGSIGAVCSRLLAQAIHDVVLVSIEPEKLIDLKRTIEGETPGARVTIATRPGDLAADCDLIVTATSAFGQRILDLTRVQPGAVICDVARPSDISREEAELRPDVLVIESGEVVIPGPVDFGYDIGLPPGTAYACLAETALLAMEGRFESYTLGRNLSTERVKEIYRLFKKHRFRIAGLRSFDQEVSDEMLAEKRRIAEAFRRDPKLFERVRRQGAAKLSTLPVRAKGVAAKQGLSATSWAAVATGLAAAVMLVRRRRRTPR